MILVILLRPSGLFASRRVHRGRARVNRARINAVAALLGPVLLVVAVTAIGSPDRARCVSSNSAMRS